MKNKRFFNLINHIDQWDKRIILRYNKFDNKFFLYFLKSISFFGHSTIWMLLTAFFLFLWYDPYLSGYIGMTFLNGIWLNILVKTIINRQRPFESLDEIIIFEPKPHSRSFPSWHSYNGLAQAIILAYLLNSLLFLILFLIIALLIGFSRIKLGVHYPSDVIAGFFLGFLGAIMTISFFGPLIVHFIVNFEKIILLNYHYYQFNPLLANFWYILLCILICGVIIIPTTKKYFKNEKKQK